MQCAEKERPLGLKPDVDCRAYAALKGRSSTVMHAFVSFSASCEVVPQARESAAASAAEVGS
jgi:hypothetical protein